MHELISVSLDILWGVQKQVKKNFIPSRFQGQYEDKKENRSVL